ncbi:phospholipase A2 inhibitor and Ly6/PLAUR domain-containing protein-like [Discoglossus pictus]
MIVILSFICILSTSIVTGDQIACQECFNDTSTSCTGHLTTCGSCLTIVTEKVEGANNTSYMVQKSCSLIPQVCNTSYSFTAGNISESFTSSCCETNQCNNGVIKAVPQNTTENGVRCPSCIVTNAENCTANETKKCTGLETKCITFSGKIFEKGVFNQYAFQGCATENICTAEKFPSVLTQLKDGFKLNCSEGNQMSQYQVNNSEQTIVE